MYDRNEEKKPHPFFDNPYYAPLADPIKNVFKITMMPLSDFVEATREAAQDVRDEGEYNWPCAFFERQDGKGGFAGFVALAGAVLGGLSAAFTGGVIAGSALTSSFGLLAGIGGGVVTAFAAGAVGAVVGPFVVAAGVAALSFSAGLGIGLLPGIAVGGFKALKHWWSERAKEKELAPVTETTAPAPPANDDAAFVPYNATKAVLASIRALSEADRRKVFDNLKAVFEPAAAKAEVKDQPLVHEAPALAKGGAFDHIGKLGG